MQMHTINTHIKIYSQINIKITHTQMHKKKKRKKKESKSENHFKINLAFILYKSHGDINLRNVIYHDETFFQVSL